jgi:nitrite reductase/ring-hydroxylating ferredoxin subunit
LRLRVRVLSAVTNLYPCSKEVQLGEQSILLSKIKGSFYATSAKCTHYGGPLVKGTLASDGRIMW